MRNRAWRQQQQQKKVIKRLKRWADGLDIYIKPDGSRIYEPNWTDLLGSSFEHFAQNTSTPCSCPMCSYLKYDRIEFKRQTLKQLQSAA